MYPVIEIAGLAVAAGVTLLVALVVRNPRSPKIINTEGAAVAASLFIVVVLIIVATYAMQGFLGVGLNHYEAAMAIAATLIASTYLIWKAFRIGERLKRADAGHSPFAAPEREVAAPPIKAQAH